MNRTALLSAGLSILLALPATAADFETAPTLQASDVLAAELLSSDNHQVEPAVTSDGLLNHYTIHSSYGDVTAVSTATAIERIHEYGAIAKLEAMKNSKVFTSAVKSGALKVVDGAKNLVTSPIKTVSGTVSGVAKMFQRVGNSAFSRTPADSEDGRLKAVFGYTAVKREYAAKLGVDPYSDNPILQQHLDDVAWTAFAGGIATTVAFSAVPGAAGAVTTTTRTTSTALKADLRLAPLDLEKRNRDILSGMDINEEIRETFLKSEAYTPALKTYITNSLSSLGSVAGRQDALMTALLTDAHDVADYRQRQLSLYADYHVRQAPLSHFVRARGGSALLAESSAGEIILAAPMDYVSWTSDIGRAFLAEQFNPMFSERKKVLWITGSASPLARQELATLGWQVVENAGAAADKATP